MMDEKILKYRQKHAKFSYCKYCVYEADYQGGEFAYCEAKHKPLADLFIDMTKVPRWFCTCYEVNDSL